MKRYLLLLALSCIGSIGCTTVQPVRPLSELTDDQTLRPRSRVSAQVALVGPRSLEGRLQNVRRLRVTADSVFWRSVHPPRDEVAVPLDRVEEVRLVRSTKESRSAFFGAAIGALIGTAVGYSLGTDCSRVRRCSWWDCYYTTECISAEFRAGAVGLLGSLGGAFLGAVSRFRTVYTYRNESTRTVSWNVAPFIRPGGVARCTLRLSL